VAIRAASGRCQLQDGVSYCYAAYRKMVRTILRLFVQWSSCHPPFALPDSACTTECCKSTLRGIVRWPWSVVRDKAMLFVYF